MGAYRIGRIQLPWTNLTPPISGGVYRSYPDPECSSSSSSSSVLEHDEWSDTSDNEAVASSTTSLESFDYTSTTILKQPQPLPQPVTRLRPQHRAESTGPRPRHLSPSAYISQAVQDEIDSDTRDNPSLDVNTQNSINAKYQNLHQRVKDEGFYECQYLEYGRELVRYLTLFALFLVCLRWGWYLTSACLLGLFWVTYDFQALFVIMLTISASNHVHCP